MKKLLKLVLKTIVITLTVVATLTAISVAAALAQANQAIDECGGTTNDACIMRHL